MFCREHYQEKEGEIDKDKGMGWPVYGRDSSPGKRQERMERNPKESNIIIKKFSKLVYTIFFLIAKYLTT